MLSNCSEASFHFVPKCCPQTMASARLIPVVRRHRLLPVLHKLRDASCAASSPKGAALRAAAAMAHLELTVATSAGAATAAEAVGVMLKLSSSKGGARNMSAEVLATTPRRFLSMHSCAVALPYQPS